MNPLLYSHAVDARLRQMLKEAYPILEKIWEGPPLLEIMHRCARDIAALNRRPRKNGVKP